MRTTQMIGHTAQVEKILASCTRLSKIGEATGMFEETACELYKYRDKDGVEWYEFVQEEPWSSGPMIFLAIRNVQGKVLGWTWDKSVEGQEFDYESGKLWV